MTVFDNFKSKNIDELVEWLNEYGQFDASPWMYWWDKNYCQQCEEDSFYDADRNWETICAYCEYSGKCRFFPDMNEVPSVKQIIKMWLEGEI